MSNETLVDEALSDAATGNRIEADPQPIPEHDFEVGSVVRTKGGFGSPMTIEHIDGHVAACVWFNTGNELQRSHFIIGTLAHY